jgi:hypothetical protein
MSLPCYKRALAAAAIAGGIAALLIRGCHDWKRDGDSGESARASRVSVKEGMNIIKIDSATMAKSGIATAPLPPCAYHEVRSFYGRVVDPITFRRLRDDYASAWSFFLAGDMKR